jgi:hypothetical protein
MLPSLARVRMEMAEVRGGVREVALVSEARLDSVCRVFELDLRHL